MSLKGKLQEKLKNKLEQVGDHYEQKLNKEIGRVVHLATHPLELITFAKKAQETATQIVQPFLQPVVEKDVTDENCRRSPKL